LTSLTVDIGNTSIKAGFFENNVLQSVFRFEDMNGLLLFCQELPYDTPIIISCVTNDDLGSFYKHFTKLINLNHTTSLPISNRYKTPETLGNDRLAAVTGAAFLYEGKNILVIDAGTCIKYDFITADREYYGGSISPGIEMKFKALNQYTGKLPLVEKDNIFQLSGDSTVNAILSGVMMGSQMEMQGYIDAYADKYGDIEIIMTGGDQAFFANRLKGTIFAEPDLVLKGLLEILKNNVPQL